MMMFPILALCVCLAALFLVLCATALLSWPLLAIAVRRLRCRPGTAANIFLAGRTFPLLLAVIIVLGLVLPAFLRFEPHSTGEGMGAKLLLLSVAGAVALLAMAVRGVRILKATAFTERRWRARSEQRLVDVGGSPVRVNVVAYGPPALLAVTGFFRPRIFVARQVARMLTPEELSAALAHELAHVHFFDNLKRLLLKITQPPHWLDGAAVDAAWTNASEVVADEAALAQGASAVDLASALVKIGTLKTDSSALGPLAASHLVPDASGSSLAMRIQCLQSALAAGRDENERSSLRRGPWQIAGVLALVLVFYAAAVITLLPSIHEALELLVR